MAVIGAPVLIWALCLGCGLAVERLLRIRVGNALLLPLGLCTALVIVYPGYAAGVGDPLAIALLGLVAIGGLIFARGGLRSRVNPGLAGVAGLAVYVLYMLPVIAHGQWTWSGYDFVNDTAFEMILANHIKAFGITLGNIPESSQRQFVAAYLASSYPLGAQSLLGTLSGITATNVAVLYQGFLASLAAISAIALASAARGLLDTRRAAVVGFGALAANLTYQYALQGEIKEMALLAAVCAAIALGREAIAISRPYAGAALVAIAAAAALTAYNVVAVPFLGSIVLMLGVGIVIAQRRLPRVRWAGPLSAGACVTAVLAVPPLLKLPAFFELAQAGQGSSGVGAIQLGQLLRVLPFSQISGVWLSGEYRLPIAGHTAALLTSVVTIVIFIAAAGAVAWALWRGDTAIPMAAGTVGLILLIAMPRVSPYAQAKLLAMCSPLVVAVALAGLVGMRRRWLAPAGMAAGAVVLLFIVASDILAYSHDTIAPTAQVEAIEQTGKRFAGRGPVLWNEFEEYAKYFARGARISAPFEAITPQQVQLRTPAAFYGHYFDLDEELLSFVEGYPYIVTRRSPAASRPPANYRLVYENAYYKGWKRTAYPKVIEHMPLQQAYRSTARIECRALAAMVAKAPRGSRLEVALAPEEQLFQAASDRHRTAGWPPDPAQAGAVLTTTAGQSEGTVRVHHAGTFAVWAQGDFPRPAYVEVNGRTVGSVKGANTPGQWLQAASVHLHPGRYRLRIYEIGGHSRHLGPGEWGVGEIGAVALQRERPERMRTVALSRYRSLCGTRADWVEVVRR